MPPQGKSILARLLDGSLCVLVGFSMARMAIRLHRQCNLRVEGVDLSTLFSNPGSTRRPRTAAELASQRVHPDVDRRRIHELWYEESDDVVCLQAWISTVIAQASLWEIQNARKVNTRNLEDSQLACLSQLLLNAELLDAQRPTQMENEFESVDVGDHGQLVIRNARYNSRVRSSKQTSVIMETSHGHSIVGHAVHAQGKQTGVKIVGGNFRGEIERIRVVGREELTHAELARDEFVLHLLQGVLSSPLLESPYIRMLWFSEKMRPRVHRPSSALPFASRFSQLNDSQRQVVTAMLSKDEPIVIVHGPPGTGKTTTIAAALDSWEDDRCAAWVIAQSNVGVKNIARTLVKYGIDFRLLVSKEFYVEWHEHLYEEIEERLIRSDELVTDMVEAERKLGASRIVLCTVSMLSNPVIDNCGIYRLVPVERLVVDEASQIDTFEFMHLFHKFRRLEKVCMFGDPKQLPPYGKEAAPNIKTIFDIKQLKPAAYFLNTQYRMPTPLGEFISERVYDSKLRSVHPITERSAVCLVDVRKGEEERVGSSWKNVEEARTVVNIIKNYYKSKQFCIITPYDAQRAEITRQLKAAQLPWESVYNVDSFQGHGAPYVIVSAVRTTSAGFLRSRNRSNVMLTRCEHGMVLVSSRAFLLGAARTTTLLGELAERWSGGSWNSDVWIDALALSDGRASLPGAPGRATPAYSIGRPQQSASAARQEPAAMHAGSVKTTPRPPPSSTRPAPVVRNSAHSLSATPSPSPFTSLYNTSHDVKDWRGIASVPPPRTWVRTPNWPTALGAGPGVANPSVTIVKQSGRSSALYKSSQPRSDELDSSSEVAFPTLGNETVPARPTLRGQWRKGSAACRL